MASEKALETAKEMVEFWESALEKDSRMVKVAERARLDSLKWGE